MVELRFTFVREGASVPLVVARTYLTFAGLDTLDEMGSSPLKEALENKRDETVMWLGSLIERVAALKETDERIMRTQSDKLPPGLHIEANARLTELNKLERRVKELHSGFVAVMTGEWDERGVSGQREPELKPLLEQFHDFERGAELEREISLERQSHRLGGSNTNGTSSLEREWWWTATNKDDPKVSFMDRVKGFFGM